jgi:hypothetical protein
MEAKPVGQAVTGIGWDRDWNTLRRGQQVGQWFLESRAHLCLEGRSRSQSRGGVGFRVTARSSW